MGCGDSSRDTLPAWGNAASRVDFDPNISVPDPSCTPPSNRPSSSDSTMGFGERAMSAAGAAVLSVVIVNPLDVAKTRLQAQAAGVLYNSSQHHFGGHMASLGLTTLFSDFRCSPSCTHAGIFGTVTLCPPDCFRYKGTLDVFYKVIRQEGLARLWRGTNAGLALSVPTVGIYLPCYDIFRNWIEEFTSSNAPNLTPYAPLVAGVGARSLACITCYPIELARTRMQIRRRLITLVGEEDNVASVLGANFSAGFVAGSIAAAATCPLDVAKTRRQIEKDQTKALKMTTRQTLVDIWRNGGVKGLFTGIGPRVGRAGPAVGIVVSFYEVVKYVLHQGYSSS